MVNGREEKNKTIVGIMLCFSSCDALEVKKDGRIKEMMKKNLTSKREPRDEREDHEDDDHFE